MPADPAGVTHVGASHVSRDGQSYAYSYAGLARTSDLFVVEGVK